MKICIIGTGYVGLVTGACFAEAGNTVYCVDNNKTKVELLNQGYIPIYEPGLEDLIENGVSKGRLHFTTSLAEGINQADVSFIAVGTPQDKDGSADLQYVDQVCHEICRVTEKKVIIATKSTVPVGTGDKIEEIFKRELKQEFCVFSNPEFLKEGAAIADFMKPDRIVIGTNDDTIIPLMNKLYAPFTHQKNRIIYMKRRSAEITKYAANAMLALRISFMNEIANFCDAVDADVNDVRAGIGADPRIGSAFLYPGLGYGGSCFPKDVKALIRVAEDAQSPSRILKACDEVNQQQVGRFFAKICTSFGSKEALRNKKLALWGLAFKAKTDDIRESQALKLADLLLEEGVKLHVYDPEAMDNTKVAYTDMLHYCASPLEGTLDADGLIIATDWSEFKSPDFSTIMKNLKTPKIFDARNLYDGKALKAMGFEYTGVGVR